MSLFIHIQKKKKKGKTETQQYLLINPQKDHPKAMPRATSLPIGLSLLHGHILHSHCTIILCSLPCQKNRFQNYQAVLYYSIKKLSSSPRRVF